MFIALKFEGRHGLKTTTYLGNRRINTMPSKGGARTAIKVLAVSETDEEHVLRFDSLSAAALGLNVGHHSVISRAVMTNKTVNGFKLSLISLQATIAAQQARIEELQRLFGDAKIRHTLDEPVLISVVDIIKHITGTSNPHASFSRLPPLIMSQIELKYHQFSGAGERPTPVISLDKLSILVSTILANARLSTKQIQAWATKLGCSTEDIINMRIGPIECDTLEIIKQSFNMLECISQYKVLQYYVDMYIPEFNICIECDENGHEHYDQQKEADRQASITATLSTPEKPVKWVRFNPNSPEFSIGHVIHDINKYIFCHLKEATTHASHEQEQKKQKLQCQLEIEQQYTLQLQAEVEKLQLIIASQGVSL